MREDKRKSLEAKGRRVGSVGEFLDLSPDEVASLELKLRLAEGLRETAEKSPRAPRLRRH